MIHTYHLSFYTGAICYFCPVPAMISLRTSNSFFPIQAVQNQDKHPHTCSFILSLVAFLSGLIPNATTSRFSDLLLRIRTSVLPLTSSPLNMLCLVAVSRATSKAISDSYLTCTKISIFQTKSPPFLLYFLAIPLKSTFIYYLYWYLPVLLEGSAYIFCSLSRSALSPSSSSACPAFTGGILPYLNEKMLFPEPPKREELAGAI